MEFEMPSGNLEFNCSSWKFLYNRSTIDQSDIQCALSGVCHACFDASYICVFWTSIVVFRKTLKTHLFRNVL